MSSTHSIAAVSSISLRSFLSTVIFLSSRSEVRRSSLLVPVLRTLIAGKTLFSAILRSRLISEFPVPLNSSKITSSILDPVSISAVAIIDKLPPPSIFLAAPKNLFGFCNAFASTPPVRIFPEASGKILTGGVDANALQKPKRFFGAARNIEGGGSLSIIATALIDTGSRMDEVIFEEFKGTGNSEINLDRKIAEKRVFPAINVRKTGTRREDLLTSDLELRNITVLRKLLNEMDDTAAMEWVLDKLKDYKTNAEFFESMKRK